MTYLSIMEKLRILYETLLDFEFILVFTILLLVFTFLYGIKKLNSKKYMLCMALSFTLVFGISIISNYEILSNTFDNFSTIFFGNIYFPSIYVYIGVLVISFVSFVVSILNVMQKKIYKIINGVMFVVNNLLFVIILNIIAKNKIDIFSINSLYTDTTLVAVLEISMGLFILWILSLITVYATNCLCDRLSYKKVYNDKVEEEKSKIIFDPVLEVTNDLIVDNVENHSSVLVEAISSDITTEDTINDIDTVIENVETINENIVMEDSNVNEKAISFTDILNGTVPVTYYDNETVEHEFNIIDPQAIYENKYNEMKNDNVIFNSVNISIDDNVDFETVKENIDENNVVFDTISLNDLVHEDKNINTLEIESEKIDSNGYTIDDYKKISGMLNSIKARSNGANINIEDAVAISLINNYSIDDCLKFRNMLKGNLN